MLFDRLMTAGRASLAWQENRPRITGPYQGATLSVAPKDLSHETQNGPTCLRSPREPVQTGEMPLVARQLISLKTTPGSSSGCRRRRGYGPLA